MDVERRKIKSLEPFKSKLRKVDAAMTRDDYRDGEAKSFKFSWQRSDNICKAADFCIRHTFSGKHDDVQATRHQFSRSPALALGGWCGQPPLSA